MHPIVSIIIVNYNAGPYLARCLDSLKKQSIQDLEVIVVDNASKDQSLADAEQRPWVKVVKNNLNLGFAAAQNQGLRLAQGMYLMPLNFDIYLTPEFLETAVATLEKYPQVGTVSGKMLRMLPDGQWTDVFDNAGILLPRRRLPIHRGSGEHDHGQYQELAFVFGAMGAAALYRREMLEDIAYTGQYFDESFFTWYEDIDLDWRGRLRGWDCLYVPEAVVFHIGDPQKNQLTAFAARHGIRNRWQMILANECPHCLVHDFHWFCFEELALLRHVTTHRLFKAYLKALIELIQRMPSVISKRRWVRRRAIRSCLPEYPLSVSAR
jgi:GT2 family glycosyltransferase